MKYLIILAALLAPALIVAFSLWNLDLSTWEPPVRFIVLSCGVCFALMAALELRK